MKVFYGIIITTVHQINGSSCKCDKDVPFITDTRCIPLNTSVFDGQTQWHDFKNINMTYNSNNTTQ
jgi:hypothetical protein